jgi:hypothetical protein
MSSRHLTRLLATLIFSLSTTACTASNQDATSQEAILGRWYPNSNSQAVLDLSPFLDISKDKFVFEGDSIFYVTLLGATEKRPREASASILVFKVTDEIPSIKYGYGCVGGAKYIRVGIMPYDDAFTMYMGDRVFIEFYGGDVMLTNDGGYEFSGGCGGYAFRRKETVGVL